MNIDVADLVDVLREYELRLQRSAATVVDLERERDELLATITRSAMSEPLNEEELDALAVERDALLEKSIDLTNLGRAVAFLDNVAEARDEGHENSCVYCGTGTDGDDPHEDFCPCAGEAANERYAEAADPRFEALRDED